jgi:hypothetical protein
VFWGSPEKKDEKIMRLRFKVIVFPLMFVLVMGGPIEAFAKPAPQKLKVDTSDSASTGEREGLSAEDLGFSQADIKSDPQFQKDLEARSDMLKIHQTLGLITAVPMTTEYVLGLVTAGNVANGNTDTSLHATLGLATAGLYITTAMFAILAPKPKGLKATGASEFHQILSWIHMPLMILTPLVGDMANDRIANHKPVGDLATIHFAMATTLVVSYLSSITVMSF